MATLNLTSWSIINNEDNVEVASNVNPTIARLSFGDYYTGTFLYTTDATINSTFEVRFNPGLFVTDGFTDDSNLNKPTETYYLRRSGLTNTFQTMGYVGPSNAFQTGKNKTYECRKVTANTFEIRMRFYMTSDTRGYLGSVVSGQGSRFTSDEFSQSPTTYSNGDDTIYTTNESLDTYCLGMYCSILFKQTNQVGITLAQASFPYTSTAAFTATRITGLGIDFLADGWDNPCGLGTGPREVQITVRQINGSPTPIDYTFTGTLDPSATTSTVLYFTSSVNFPLGLANYFTVTDFVILPCGDEFTYGVMGAASSIVKKWDFLNIDGRFVDEGSHINRTFKLKRGGLDVSSLIPTATTNVEFEFDYTGTLTTEAARVWFIPVNVGNSATTDWITALGRTPIQFRYVDTVTSLGADRYRLTYNVDGVAYNLQNGQTFHILYVVYDTVNKYYASYVQQNVTVSTKIEVPDDGPNCQLEISGNLSTYRNEFPTDYLRVSPLQRVKATTRYNKLLYNSCTTFSNVSRITATLELLDSTVLDTVVFNVFGGIVNNAGGNTFVINLTDTLELNWTFRIEDAYTDKEIRVKWMVNSLTEPTETIYYQQFRVDKYQQDLDIADQILDRIDFIDSDGFYLDDNGRNCSGEDLIVETRRNPSIGEDDYQQVAVWLDDSRFVEEEDGFLGTITGLPPLTTQFQSDVIEAFSTDAPDTTVRHKITSSVNEGQVGMIGYPPPFIPLKARVMIHNTLPNGRNVAFKLQHKMLAGTKTLSVLGGVANTSDYTFRVGNNAAQLRDANDLNWSFFPTLTWFQFLNEAAAIGDTVRVEYNGASTQTDIPAYLDYFTDTPINAINQINVGTPTIRRTAGRDIMMYTGTDTNFTGVTSTNVNRYTEKRTVGQLAASSDLVTYSPFLPVISAAFQPPNSTTGNHLFLEETVVGALDNLAIDTQVIASGLTLSSIATPINNAFYPVTGNGVNPSAIFNDRINDFFEVEDNAVKNAFDFNQIPNGSYINVDFCIQASNTQGQRFLCLNSYVGTLDTEREFSFGIYPGGLFFNLTQAGGTRGFGFISPAGGIAVDNGVYKGSFSIQKIGNTLVAATTIANAVGCMNGFTQEMQAINIGGGSIEPMPNLNGRGTNSLEVGSYVNAALINPTAPPFAPRKTQEIGFSISLTPLTPKDMIEYHRGLRSIATNQYAWRYDVLNADPNLNFRRVPNIGTLANANNFVLTQQHENSLTTLFT